MTKKRIAFDIGASSGRAILGSLDGDKLILEEIHRFKNQPKMIDDTLCWDIDDLFENIKIGLSKASDYDSVGIDTWGVDFGLVGKDGRLIATPVHYRDKRTKGIIDEVFNLIEKEELYKATGIQFIEFNTIFQLYYMQKNQSELLKKADKILLIPDLLTYFLTGTKQSELTVSSTTGMLSAKKQDWDKKILENLNIPTGILPKIVENRLAGKLKSEYSGDAKDAPDVYYVAAHDTASAVMACPSEEQDAAYLSSGTWSLLGCENAEPIITAKGLEYNFTNEIAFDGKIRLLKNIMGLWIIQECLRDYTSRGEDVTFADLEREAMAATPFKAFIDPDSYDFVAPNNMPERIVDFCRKTGQSVPETRGEIVRTVYESLAMKYRVTLANLESLTGKKYPVLHIIGGGTKDRLLCQMTANAIGKTVTAGPTEATAIGNLLAQFMLAKDITQETAKKLISTSFEVKEYKPQGREWNENFERFKKIVECE